MKSVNLCKYFPNKVFIKVKTKVRSQEKDTDHSNRIQVSVALLCNLSYCNFSIRFVMD